MLWTMNNLEYNDLFPFVYDVGSIQIKNENTVSMYELTNNVGKYNINQPKYS